MSEETGNASVASSSTDSNMEELKSKLVENVILHEREIEKQAIDNASKDEQELVEEKTGSVDLLAENDDKAVVEENGCTAHLVGLLFEKIGEKKITGANEHKVASKEGEEQLALPEITITRPSESESITEEDSLIQAVGSLEEEQNVTEFVGEDKSENSDEDDTNSSIFPEDETNDEMNNDLGDDSDKLMRGKSVMYFPQREVRNGKVIGEGGFGRVLKGNLHGGTPVAIKLFHAPFTRLRDPSELENLLALKHKNIVTVFGIVEQTVQFDCPQLVFQYVSEGSVLQYLSRHENPEDNTTLGKIALDIVEGCQYLQQCGIVHGNLAARNIMVERVIGRQKTYYNAKISDVGFIKFAEGSGGNYMKLPGGNRIIPVRWVPKEIIDVQEDGSIGSDFTYKSDVWSFGVVLWEIWTRGAIPYGASYSNLRVIQFLMDGFSPLKVHRPSECPPKVVSVMESIFRVNPAERPSFDKIHDCFKSYKGYGKENKVKSTSRSVPPTTPKGSSKYTASGAEDSSGGATSSVEVTTSDQVHSKFDEKLKKKKLKKNKKAFSGIKGEDIAATSQGGAAAMMASNVPRVSPKPTYKHEPPYHQQETITDPTIAALLKRVNQLEKERRGGGYMTRGGGGGSVPRSPHWQKRVGPGPPRFSRGRGGYHHQDYIEDRGSPVAVGRGVSSSPPPPPPASSQAPPPYTEDPLPHHSTSRFSGPLPEYDYSGPGGRGSPGAYPGDRIQEMGRPGGPQARVVGGVEEDYIRKVRRLAEEIEVLRAEKMTQELLKKSAELAGVMKIMTTERSKLPTESPRYSNGSSSGVGGIGSGRGSPSSQIPPRLVRRSRYYEDDDYDNNYEYGNSQHFDGPHQHHRSWNSSPGGVHRHERNSRGDYQGSQPPQQSSLYGNSQRRPYYMKSRGGVGNGNRGGYGGGGRYHDSDDTAYGQ